VLKWIKNHERRYVESVYYFYLACPNTLLSKFTASPVATLRHRNILD
jgi:hypothetical protein